MVPLPTCLFSHWSIPLRHQWTLTSFDLNYRKRRRRGSSTTWTSPSTRRPASWPTAARPTLFSQVLESECLTFREAYRPRQRLVVLKKNVIIFDVFQLHDWLWVLPAKKSSHIRIKMPLALISYLSKTYMLSCTAKILFWKLEKIFPERKLRCLNLISTFIYMWEIFSHDWSAYLAAAK